MSGVEERMEQRERGGRQPGCRLPPEVIRAAALLVSGVVLLAACSAEQPADDRSNQVSGATTATNPAPAGETNPSPASRDDRRGGADGRRTILFVGTSLTAGLGLEPEQAYTALIQDKIDSAGLAWDVVPSGVSGETSASLLRRIGWLVQEPFDAIVIETGANDGLRGIPVEAMRDNIQQVIDTVRAARPQATIVLVQMEALPNLGADYTRRFREVFPELARRNDIQLLPFLLEGVAGVRSLNQGDGIHPNVAGERIVAENVWRGLRPLLR